MVHKPVKCGCRPLFCVCCCCTIPQRVTISLISLFGIVIAYGHRVVFNIAMTKMVSVKIRAASNECAVGNASATPPMGHAQDWDERTQQILLLAFFGGYLIFHIPAGVLADIIGPRLVYVPGMIISTILTAATPFTAMYTHWAAVMVLRGIMGVAQAGIYPAVSVLMAMWIPKQERGLWGAFSMAASSVGIAVGNLASGQIMNLFHDWKICFYFYGISGVIWIVLAFMYLYDNHKKHPRITPEEKEYLDETLVPSQRFKIPWKDILKDKGVIALTFGCLGSDFWLYLNVTNIPKYMDNILHMDMLALSLCSSLPSLLLWVSSVISGKIVDAMIARWNHLKWNRRLSSIIGVIFPCGFSILVGYMGCDSILAVVMYCMSNLTKGPFYASLKVNHLDLTTNFAGVVMAISNGVGCLAGIVGPLVVGYGPYQGTIFGWLVAFWIICGLNFVCHLVFFFFCQVERAPWDFPPPEQAKQ